MRKRRCNNLIVDAMMMRAALWWVFALRVGKARGGFGDGSYPVFPGHEHSSWLISIPVDKGHRSGIRILRGKQAAVCVPPKCGSMAANELFPSLHLEWTGEPVVSGESQWRHHDSDPLGRSEGSHERIERWLLDAERVRVAIVRHPVERLISSMRAFGVGEVCDSCRRKGLRLVMETTPMDPEFERAMLFYARHELRNQTRRDCSVARLPGPLFVNQHFRSLRCFCASPAGAQISAKRCATC